MDYNDVASEVFVRRRSDDASVVSVETTASGMSRAMQLRKAPGVASKLQSILLPGYTMIATTSLYHTVARQPNEIMYDASIMDSGQEMLIASLRSLMSNKWRGSNIISGNITATDLAIMILACEDYSLSPQTVVLNKPTDIYSMWGCLTTARTKNILGLGAYLSSAMKGRDVAGYTNAIMPVTVEDSGKDRLLEVVEDPSVIYDCGDVVRYSGPQRFQTLMGLELLSEDMRFIHDLEQQD